MGRFDKKEPTPFEQWAKENTSSQVTRMRSMAHMMRVMYNNGLLNKSQSLELLQKAIRSIEAGQGDTDRKAEIAAIKDAIEEMNGLPDDR